MKCLKNEDRRKMNIKMNGDKLEEVEEFCYLGSIITKDNRSKRDIRSRVAQAKKAFAEKKHLLTSNLDIEIKKRFLKAYLWSVALYDSESWTLGKDDKRNSEAFEMWCYRKMMKISWTDRVTNEEVLNQVKAKRTIWNTLQRRRDKMIGHILRPEGLTHLIVEGIAEGKRGRGRPRMSYLDQIIQDVGASNYREMKNLAQNRQRWRVVSNQS